MARLEEGNKMSTWKNKIVGAFQFGRELWDPSHRFETSWLLPPWVLFGCRAAIVSFALDP